MGFGPTALEFVGDLLTLAIGMVLGYLARIARVAHAEAITARREVAEVARRVADHTEK